MGWSRYAVLAVPALGVIELLGQLMAARRAPELADWKQLEPAVAAIVEPGELVVVAPGWAEPNARWALGDRFMPVRNVARPDESAYPRALEVGILGLEAPELDGWPVAEEREAGPFLLRVRENPSPVNVQFDFTDGLRPPQASVFEGGDPAPCPWKTNARRRTGGLGGNPAFPSKRFDCASGEYFFAGVTVIDDHEYRPRRCVWAHPPTKGDLAIRYEDVPLGAVVRGYGGLPWIIERDEPGTPVDLEVRIDDQTIGTFRHADGEGWKRFEFPTGRSGQRGTVEFRSRSQNAQHRHFCFHADTR